MFATDLPLPKTDDLLHLGGQSTWQAFPSVVATGARRSSDGATRRSTAPSDTRAEAEAWSRAMESEMDRGIFVSRVESEKTTLADALGCWRRPKIDPLTAVVPIQI